MTIKFGLLVVFFACLAYGLGVDSANVPKKTKETTDELITKLNSELEEKLQEYVIAQWNFGSNITQENEDALSDASKVFDKFRKEQYAAVKDIDFSKEVALKRRQLAKIAVIGTSALDNNDADDLQKAQLAMENTYSTAVLTIGDKPNQSLEPHLTKILAESTNEPELKEVWTKWRDATGPKMRDNYIKYFQLGNKAAQINSVAGVEFKTFDDLWMFSWKTDDEKDLKKEVETLMAELMPLYQKIHAYVRYHLVKKYGDEVMPSDGTIPAHLLGNMWAQQWSNILNTVTDINPHNDTKPLDSEVNKVLEEKWTVEQMFKLSEKFFSDLGMNDMTKKFWDESIIEKPTDRNLTCHASAWDFYAADKQDFRIKQCTDKSMTDLITVHHEMGHIQYFMNYADQPVVYREGANPGFHEAIGDLIALAVSTPEHLVKLGLLNNVDLDLEKVNLNYQMKMALDKIVLLPFSYVMDKWRWDLFSDESLKSKMNRHWWELRLKHQGISPPVLRSETDMDPGSKYHIPAGVEYVRYFVSHVLQFQFYKVMCEQNEHDQLYQCDFDGNKEAGQKLIKMLKAGSSDTWPNILKEFTGSDKMSLDALNEYFTPLSTFLDNFIADNNITTGWDANVDDYMVKSSAFLAGPTGLLAVVALCCIFLFLN